MKTVGYVDQSGHYVRGEDKSLTWDVNSMHKEYEHDFERKKFAREIIQPRINGQPNPEFVTAYASYSKKYFSTEEIDKAQRSLS